MNSTVLPACEENITGYLNEVDHKAKLLYSNTTKSWSHYFFTARHVQCSKTYS